MTIEETAAAILGRQATINEKGKRRRVTMQEVLLMAQVKKDIAGDHRAAKLMLDLSAKAPVVDHGALKQVIRPARISDDEDRLRDHHRLRDHAHDPPRALYAWTAGCGRRGPLRQQDALATISATVQCSSWTGLLALAGKRLPGPTPDRPLRLRVQERACYPLQRHADHRASWSKPIGRPDDLAHASVAKGKCCVKS